MKAIKVLSALTFLVILSSCNFDINLAQENGNGNVVTEERHLSGDFDKVKGSAGLDVYLTEGSENKVIVEADENLLKFIETEVNNGRLKVTTSRNIGKNRSKKVHVTYTRLEEVAASSGADVIVNSVLKSETISLDVSSGANLEAEVFAREVFADASSGADLKISGKATSLRADSSSGSEIDAKELLVINCNAEASSGSNITVNVKEKLRTEASSGGTIRYYGDPTAVSNNDSRSGSVKKM